MVESEYKEDAERIERDYVSPDSETPDEVRADLEDADFAQASIDEIMGDDWIVDSEDVPVDPDNAHVDGIMTRDEVGDAVDQASSDAGVDTSRERRDNLTDSVSREVGAPERSDLDAAQISTVSESVTPGEVIEGDTRSTPVSVVRDTSGEVVGTIGSRSAGTDVAEQVGGEYLGDLTDYTESMTAKPAPGGDRAMLYAETPDGERPVGEVDL